MKITDMKTISSVIFLSFLIIILLVIPVNGSSNWVRYARSKGDILLYNKVNIKHRTKHIVQVWTKIVFSDEGKETYIRGSSNGKRDKLSFNKSLVEIDCMQERVRSLSFTQYNADGHVLMRLYHYKPEWIDIPPNSAMDMLRENVCK